MSQNGPGRPPKSNESKRQPLHISLYAEDLERLEELTDNRSEFLRNCIQRAWEEQNGEHVTLTVSLPKWLVEELLQTLTAQLPSRQASLLQTLLRGLMAQATVHRANGTDGHGAV